MDLDMRWEDYEQLTMEAPGAPLRPDAPPETPQSRRRRQLERQRELVDALPVAYGYPATLAELLVLAEEMGGRVFNLPPAYLDKLALLAMTSRRRSEAIRAAQRIVDRRQQ